MTFKERVISEINKAKIYIEGKNIKKVFSKEFIKSLSVKSKGIIIVGIVVFIGLSTLTVIKFSSNDKKELLQKSVIALQKGNVNSLENLIRFENGDKLTKEQLAPIVKFYKADEDRITKLKTALSKGEELYSMSVDKEDKLIADNYFIGVSYADINIKTNIKNTKVFIDGKSNGVINGDKTIKFIAPGIYDIAVENENKYAVLKSEKQITVTKNEDEDINIDGVSVNVNTNIPNATVYINDTNTGTLASDFKDVGPFPTDGSYSISLKYKTPFGEVASAIAKIHDVPDIKLDLNLKSPSIEASLNNTIGKFYSSVFSAIDMQDASKISFATKDSANKIYNDIKENGFILKNVYKLNSSSIDFEKSNIDFKDGVYTANIVANINYNVKKEILGVPLKSDDYDQSFFTNLKYEDGQWQVYDTEKLNLKTIN
ncbi:TcaA 3rd/4th domain-containing protein [uncultured Clostridium sp.]|uniref:TcaA 3rd/4th domain-containing protein n=1 Tax=uncultured Clostridium sp. TaxID=59620 RepID=UPI002633737B|nr:hypothetical protein [uncultured Clostridium sp.]